jgi:CBS domain containing-hemolysin-like protein
LSKWRKDEEDDYKLILFLLEDTKRLIITILLGNITVNVAIASILEGIASEIFKSNAISLAIFISTILLLFFGEITPKNYAINNAISLSKKVAPFLYIFYKLFSIIINIIVKFTDYFFKLIGKSEENKEFFIEQNELKEMVNVYNKHGVINKEETEMINSIFEFGETLAKEIMIPRIDIECIDINLSFDEVMEFVDGSSFSKIPVYKKSKDNIVGILYIKELLKYKIKDEKPQIKDILHTPFNVPETKKIKEILNEFRRRKVHIAVLVDEYGGTAGIITLEDILEEIVGEIYDEYDKVETNIIEINKNTKIFDSIFNIDEFKEIYDIEIEDDSYDTLGGFLYTLLGHIPKKNEKIEYDRFTFIIESIENNRISKIRVIENNNDNVKVEEKEEK